MNDLRSLPDRVLHLYLYSLGAWGIGLLLLFGAQKTVYGVTLCFPLALWLGLLTGWWGITTFQRGRDGDLERDEIRAGLLKESARRIAREMDQQIKGELIARNEVPLPPSMVSRYLEAGMGDFRARAERMGYQPTAEDEQKYREASRTAAEKDLRGMLLLEAVRKQEEIKVSDEDVEERIVEIATENGFDVDRYREFVNSGDEKDRIGYDLAERRAYDFLLSRAEITEVAADADIAIP